MTRYAATFFLILVSSLFGLNPAGEATEWGAICGLGIGALGFSRCGPFTDEPIIGGATDAPHLEDRLSNPYFYGACFGLSTVFLAMPANEMGVRYRYLKGYLEAAAATSFITNFSKDFFGSPRPDADARKIEGFDERHIRDSFPSGHSSFAFATATYLALYSWEEFGNNEDWRWLIGKGALTAALAGGASWVAYSRVDNNEHRPRDVIAGATIGGAVATGAFIFQKSRLDKNIAIEPIEGGLTIVWRF